MHTEAFYKETNIFDMKNIGHNFRKQTFACVPNKDSDSPMHSYRAESLLGTLWLGNSAKFLQDPVVQSAVS